MIREALIHAGGQGTRLRPVTYEIPKPLVPVQGLPILTWQVRWLTRYGIERIVVTISPQWRENFTRWRDELSLPVTIELIEETEPLGTLGGLIHLFPEAFSGRSIVVTNGDELKGFDLNTLFRVHEEGRYLATLGLVEVKEPQHYGIPDMEGTRVVRYREKPVDPSSNFAHAGLYCVDTGRLLKRPFAERFLMFERDVFPVAATEGVLGAAPLAGPWYDCGTLERWERAIHEWREPLDSNS
jgi:NDP-sugar pyrophosphorylase family protein